MAAWLHGGLAAREGLAGLGGGRAGSWASLRAGSWSDLSPRLAQLLWRSWSSSSLPGGFPALADTGQQNWLLPGMSGSWCRRQGWRRARLLQPAPAALPLFNSSPPLASPPLKPADSPRSTSPSMREWARTPSLLQLRPGLQLSSPEGSGGGTSGGSSSSSSPLAGSAGSSSTRRCSATQQQSSLLRRLLTSTASRRGSFGAAALEELPPKRPALFRGLRVRMGVHTGGCRAGPGCAGAALRHAAVWPPSGPAIT
jgi:hypothetical protein